MSSLLRLSLSRRPCRFSLSSCFTPLSHLKKHSFRLFSSVPIQKGKWSLSTFLNTRNNNKMSYRHITSRSSARYSPVNTEPYSEPKFVFYPKRSTQSKEDQYEVALEDDMTPSSGPSSFSSTTYSLVKLSFSPSLPEFRYEPLPDFGESNTVNTVRKSTSPSYISVTTQGLTRSKEDQYEVEIDYGSSRPPQRSVDGVPFEPDAGFFYLPPKKRSKDETLLYEPAPDYDDSVHGVHGGIEFSIPEVLSPSSSSWSDPVPKAKNKKK